ncbi:ABC transporter substrate-binding protein [Paracidovorax valerianellae]|uniref:Amino acid/amide ABC transporter substrate-binding protein, HAAT family (TC 3.A.1.4.-) n=1 Tax=Paracidovorax valerianellae TaxID=187868 RepID=A0A1G7CGG0_9BURK|nr:ABC transporter substrate-binding protein [Paracidovorax valerianellae]MDA8443852.1 ABC transporter substrate-binding protein [Paracidovorax valerianellae]SDE38333.1 amino acid/amide ABC transporter substrate-binding protein, HAAT family (TC 3.A.1.4.-) [Paracidovorax valerianellae]
MNSLQKLSTGLVLAAWLSAAPAQILIGQTAGFTGTVAAGVQETTDGAKLYLDAVNARGGIHGQKVQLISLDDKLDPTLAAANARKLIEEQHVSALFLTRGTPPTEAVIPVLDQHGVALVGPSTGAMALHRPVRKNVFNVRAPYQREAEKAIAHLVSIGITKIAVVHADDTFGADGLAGAQTGLDNAKLKAVLQEKVDRTKPDFSALVPKIVQSQAQAVLMIASSTAVAEGYKALRAAGSAAQLATLSNNASAGFAKSLGENARGVIVTQVFPNERAVNLALVSEAHDLAKAQGKEVSPAMLEGFAAAKVLVEGLRRAGPKPTRERIRTALEGLQKFDLGGLELSFGPDDHTGLDFAELSIIGADGKFRR